MFRTQLSNERPQIILNGGDITLDDSNITQYSYYNGIFKQAEAYDVNPIILSGRKSTSINALNNFNLKNASCLYE